MQQAAAVMDVKEQVMDTVPKRIKELQFGISYVPSNHSKENTHESLATSDLVAGRFKMYSIKALWKCVTKIYIPLKQREQRLQMELSIHVWVCQQNSDFAKPVVRPCINATAISALSSLSCLRFISASSG